MRRRRRLLWFALAITVGVVAVLCWLQALSKAEVADRLLALPKNAAMRAAGIERRPLQLRIAGTDLEAAVTMLRVVRRTPATDARRPVVLVHGTPGSLCTWTDVVFGANGGPGLADEFDVYALDVVGHGITAAELPSPLTFAACADWVAGAIEGLRLGPVHLVGNSYGGEFCWRVALDRPDLVRTLTLIDASGFQRPADGWLPEEIAMREMSLARLGWMFATREKIRGALQPHFPFPVTEDQVDECFAICRNPGNWRGMVDLARDENGAREAEIAQIAVPTLLLWGRDDIAYPVARDADRWAATVRGATLVVLPDSGHYPQETVPGRVVEHVREFARAHER